MCSKLFLCLLIYQGLIAKQLANLNKTILQNLLSVIKMIVDKKNLY